VKAKPPTNENLFFSAAADCKVISCDAPRREDYLFWNSEKSIVRAMAGDFV
jgi:hypothetical protein